MLQGVHSQSGSKLQKSHCCSPLLTHRVNLHTHTHTLLLILYFPSVAASALLSYVNCPSLLCLPYFFLPTSSISFLLFLSLYLFYLIFFYIIVFLFSLYSGWPPGCFTFQFQRPASFASALSIIQGILFV